jgi:hypothetical protein
MTPPPFYLDWTFWAFIASAVAIVLSQLPPIRLWFGAAKVEILEVQDRIFITHMIGFPNVQIHLTLTNAGGRAARVRRIFVDIARYEKALVTLECLTYMAGEERVMLMPFTLSPGEEWRQRLNGVEKLDAKEDRELFKVRRTLKANIAEKAHAARVADPATKELVVADAAVLQPVMDIFKKQFIWEPGDYQVTVRVSTSNESSDATGRYRFTLHDLDSQELRGYSDDYKYGFGPAIDSEKHAGIVCQLHPA